MLLYCSCVASNPTKQEQMFVIITDVTAVVSYMGYDLLGFGSLPVLVQYVTLSIIPKCYKAVLRHSEGKMFAC